MLFRNARSSPTDPCNLLLAGMRTSRDKDVLLFGAVAASAGLANLLVPGVEYSLSELCPNGVGTEDTDSVVTVSMSMAISRRRLDEAALPADESETVSPSSRARDAMDGLPRRDLAGVTLLSCGSSDSSSAAEEAPAFLTDLERVRRPLALAEPLSDSKKKNVSEMRRL